MTFSIDEAVIEQIKTWAVEAGKMATELQQNLTEHMKSDETPVTNADVQVEQFLVGKIRAAFPDHQVIAEESGRVGSPGEWLWAVDPIDGTKSYIRKLPIWAVSIGLLQHDRPAAGVIYLPVSDDLYWGWEGGSFWNGRRLRGPASDNYDNPLYFLAVHSNAHAERHIEYPRIQAFGSTAAHLVYVASGQAVGSLARRVHLWDLAAAVPILWQAGCEVEYISGQTVDFRVLEDGRKTPEELLATRPEWMERVRSQLGEKKPC